LIYWNLFALTNCDEIDDIVVATDGKEIKETVLAMDFKNVQVYDREPKNAQDHSSTEDVMLEYIENSNLEIEDTFVLSQLTSPFTSTQHFSEALKQFENESADSLLTCVSFKRFLWDKNGRAINYNPNQRPRRQDFDGHLMENGAFYISKVGHIKNSKNRLSGKVSIYEMPHYTSIEIDEPHDWIVAEAMMKNLIGDH